MKIIQEYFTAFSNKDLNKLFTLYDEHIRLSEWDENIFVGRDAVLKANNELFNKFKNINITIKASASQENVSLNEIIVVLDNQSVKVVDSITIDDNKITSIMAYRGF